MNEAEYAEYATETKSLRPSPPSLIDKQLCTHNHSGQLSGVN